MVSRKEAEDMFEHKLIREKLQEMSFQEYTQIDKSKFNVDIKELVFGETAQWFLETMWFHYAFKTCDTNSITPMRVISSTGQDAWVAVISNK